MQNEKCKKKNRRFGKKSKVKSENQKVKTNHLKGI